MQAAVYAAPPQDRYLDLLAAASLLSSRRFLAAHFGIAGDWLRCRSSARLWVSAWRQDYRPRSELQDAGRHLPQSVYNLHPSLVVVMIAAQDIAREVERFAVWLGSPLHEAEVYL